MPLLTIFQLYCGSRQFYYWRKPPTCRKSYMYNVRLM